MSETVSPSTRLATEITDGFIDAGLLRRDKRDAVIAKIATGGMKSGDWKLEIELASAEPEVT